MADSSRDEGQWPIANRDEGQWPIAIGTRDSEVKAGHVLQTSGN